MPTKVSSVVLSTLAALQLTSLIHGYCTWKNMHWGEQTALEASLEKAEAEKRYGDAERICRMMLEKQRSGYFAYDVWLEPRLALNLSDEKKYDEAITLLRSALQKDKESNLVLRIFATHTQNLALICAEAKRYSEAEPVFEAALELHRRDNNLDNYETVVCRKAYAKVLKKLGKPEKATVQEQEAEKVLQLHNWTYTPCPDQE